jgi:hypothetical protein
MLGYYSTPSRRFSPDFAIVGALAGTNFAAFADPAHSATRIG